MLKKIVKDHLDSIKCYNTSKDFLPDYQYWIKTEIWIHRPRNYDKELLKSEPVLLLMNFEPPIAPTPYKPINIYVNFLSSISTSFLFNLDDYKGPFSSIPKAILNNLKSEIDKKCSLFDRALESNTLSHKVKTIGKGKDSIKEYHIKPRDVIAWAIKNDFEIPEPFLVLLEEKLPEGTPPYLDPKHPSYSAELSAAVSVWLAMYEKKEIDPDNSLSPRTQIENWVSNNIQKTLGKNHKITENAIGRIATLVNPTSKKKSGRPSKKK